MAEQQEEVGLRISATVLPLADEIADGIRKTLSSTPYACTSLTPLSGGSANFIFRADLTTPLEHGTRQVTLKRGEDYVASNPAFKIPLTRCRTEVGCLAFMNGLNTVSGPYHVRTPKLYHYAEEANTQVQEYLAGALSLKDYALKHFSPSSSDRRAACLQLGQALGRWLRDFHERTAGSQAEQVRFRDEVVAANEAMRPLKHLVNYQTLLATVAEFPDILGDAQSIFEDLEKMAKAELDGGGRGNGGLKEGVIHGDFWTGNVLIPDVPLGKEDTDIFVVDWEMCEFGVRAVDPGQMIAELYELWLFKRVEEGKWLIKGFTEGYGFIDDDFAFRTALTVGTHLVCWGSRVPGWGSPDQVRSVVGTGRDVIVRAWHKDRDWFETGDLACLFPKAS